MHLPFALVFVVALAPFQDGYLPPPQDPFITVNMWESHGMEHVYAIPIGDPFEYAAQASEEGLATKMGNGSSDVEQWRPLVAGQFPPEQLENALCIIKYESGGEPRIRNLAGSNARGLFQIMTTVWADDFGFTHEDFYVPELNVYAAARIWESYGWRPWSSRHKCRL